jgi:hypothetical protein
MKAYGKPQLPFSTANSTTKRAPIQQGRGSPAPRDTSTWRFGAAHRPTVHRFVGTRRSVKVAGRPKRRSLSNQEQTFNELIHLPARPIAQVRWNDVLGTSS